ncbi:class I SAM-dependent methyltransferase [Leeia oryzae]|uniref:class I SAM-dependent methyltransferase n=1 Tax=Leeia oryzae TaxID=356662 RepID=UPI00035F9343|nr:class I SAM-dependent methyltransferase [Leeia oryzae]
MSTSIDSIKLYHKEYFLKQVDGFSEFDTFNGKFENLFYRYQRNIALLDLKSQHTYLEYGCGRGEICIYHAINGGESVGVDYSIDAIRLAQEKAKHLKVKISLFHGSFNSFHSGNKKFDRIMASEFIEHISKTEGELFIKIAVSLLNEGGKLLIFTHPNTLQRKCGYPAIRFAAKMLGKKLPKHQPDTTNEHYKLYHLNEQNFFSLQSLAKKAKVRRYKIGYDSFLRAASNQPIRNVIKVIINKTFLRHFFLTDLYLILEK